MKNKLSRKVLVGNHDEVVPRLIDVALSDLEYDFVCHHAPDAETTIELAEKESYDTIILRNRLPQKRGEIYEITNVGLEVAKQIRKGTMNKDSLIFLMSGGYFNPRIVAKAKDAQITKGIELPIDLEGFKNLFSQYPAEGVYLNNTG